jgi:hypothetical protein
MKTGYEKERGNKRNSYIKPKRGLEGRQEKSSEKVKYPKVCSWMLLHFWFS